MYQDETPAPRRRGTATLEAPRLRIVTFPAAPAAPGYREIVAGLAAEVAELPAAALGALPEALPALRAALVDARWLVGAEPAELAAALAALGDTLDLLTDGVLLPPARLGGEMAAVVRAIAAQPPSRSLALNYALRHLIGVIGAASGKLLAAGRLAALAAPAPVAAEPVVDEAAADRRFADALIVATTLVGVAVCGGLALLEAPEALSVAAAGTLAVATGWSVQRGRA